MENLLPKRMKKQLDVVLDEGERVADIVKEVWSYTKWYRWTILTDRRIIIIIRWPLGLSYDIWPMYLGALSADMNEGVVFDTIFIDYYGQKFKLQFFSKHRKRTLQFFQEINHQLILHNPASRRQATTDAIEKMEQLAKVFHDHIISQEEYDQKKRELMEKL